MAQNRDQPIQASLAGFADYGKSLKGDEKGEAQVFCDRLFQASSLAWSYVAVARFETMMTNSVPKSHEALEKAVRRAYGMKPKDDILEFLLKLNLELAGKESRGEPIQGPGLPVTYPNPTKLVTEDCIRVEEKP